MVCLATLLVLQGALFATGCAHAPRPAPGGLLERFVPAMLGADRASFRAPVSVDRAGGKKISMVLVAPSAAKASLEGFRGRIELHFMAVPVFNVGDGIQMDIWLLDEGPPVQICSRYFDPGRRFEDRRWRPVTIAMDVRRTDAQLEIRIAGGPEGNLTGDWLAFADLRISARAER